MRWNGIIGLNPQNLGDCGDTFTEDIARYDLQVPFCAKKIGLTICNFSLQFSSVLFSLLDRISQLGRDNYNEKVLNVLHRYDSCLKIFRTNHNKHCLVRLDFNGFYTTAIDQFKADTG